MSFVRPEARAALWRVRELLIALGMGCLGLFWGTQSGGLLGWLGWAILALGVVFAVMGAQRLRFRLGIGGPGVVQIDEGQISYFGPLSGGAIALSELSRIVLDPTSKPRHWVLSMPGQPDLHIPVTAEGADALFDAFSALPGLRMERMLSEMHKPDTHQVVIWERNPERVSRRSLH